MPHRTFTAGDVDYITRLNALASALDRRLAQNVLTNGSFQVWQRGTSFANATTVVYGPDRWGLWRGSPPFTLGATVSRQTGDSPSRYCARVQRDSGNTSTTSVVFRQALTTENSIALRGKRLGMRFKARKGANFSASSSILTASVISGTGTDQHPSAYTGSATQASTTCTLTTSWQYFTLDVETIAGSVTELAFGFIYTPVGTAGAADYFEVQEVQVVPISDSNVDVGDYPWRSFEEELAACLPYYEKSFAYATAPAQNAGTDGAFWFPQLQGASTSQRSPFIAYKAIKRSSTPTVTLYNPAAASAQIRNTTDATNWTLSTAEQGNANGFIVQGTSAAGSATGELQAVHWTAEAEIV
jgi:hypothetical protein